MTELEIILADLPNLAIAVSGGVDSMTLAHAAHRAGLPGLLVVHALSPAVPAEATARVRDHATRFGWRLTEVDAGEFADPEYHANPVNRCYFCKTNLYARIAHVTEGPIASGANVDDLGDYRPGLIAAAEHRVRHPLQEAGFTKADVRALARAWDLPTWDKPASPCLSSRLAPGVAVTPERTARVEAAEAYLKKLGYREFRVRLHEGELARIEVPPEGVAKLADPIVGADLVRYLKELGFRYVTIDLEGFRTGNLNELIPLEIRDRNRLTT